MLATISACSTAQPDENGIVDPFEDRNRKVHAVNVALDKALVRPSSNAYGSVLPDPARNAVSNFAENLDMPRMVLNDLLQFRLGDAIHNSLRFAVNTTFGVGGLFDPATDMGIDERSTDFGETLHVWRIPEGAYVELPLLGPSTERDAAGRLVDFVINPMRLVLDVPESNYATGASIFARVGDRYEYSGLVDELLYESADSYAQARLIYLMNRRYELGISETDEYYDPYYDPYEDPYAQ
ncbi:MAG: MlaA family lipoprotein [Brevirhabdus sp.]